MSTAQTATPVLNKKSLAASAHANVTRKAYDEIMGALR